MTDFPEAPVTVTLSGEEWFSIMLHLSVGKDALSPKDRISYAGAIDKLARQITAASEGCLAARTMRPALRLVEPAESEAP